jgi:hypothetical protein
LLLGAQFGTGSSDGKGSSLLSFGAGVGLELSGGKKQKSEQNNTVSTSSIVMINLATTPHALPSSPELCVIAIVLLTGQIVHVVWRRLRSKLECGSRSIEARERES